MVYPEICLLEKNVLSENKENYWRSHPADRVFFGTRSSSLEIIFGRCAGSVDRSKCLLSPKSFSVREPHRVMVVKAQLQFVGDPLQKGAMFDV